MTKLDGLIKNSKSICVLGHINPDGDCVGATLGLYNYIINRYNTEKFVKVYLQKPSEKFSVLSGYNEISQSINDAIEYDLCIICDCSNKDRIKEFSVYMDSAKKIIIIDHHETNNIDCENLILDSLSPATCELVYKNIDKNFINKKIAECIYVGIAHDTGVFRYTNTTSSTLRIVADLMDKNIDFNYLLDTTMFMQKFNQKRIMSEIINRTKFLCNGRVVMSFTNEDEVKKFSLDNRDIDFVVGNLRETVGIDLAVFAYEIGINIYKISLRSNNNDINCAEFSKKFGGGGHKKAAGFTLKMEIRDIYDFLNKNLLELFND